MAYMPRKWIRTVPPYSLVAPGAPVRGAGTWIDVADGAMWIAGKGAQLVPGFNPACEVADTVTKTLRFRVRPRNFAVERIWSLSLRTTSTASVLATVRAPTVTGTAQNYVLFPGITYVIPVSYRETLAARSSTEQEISISVLSTGGTIQWEWVECYEQDRSALADNATDYGIRTETLSARAPIFNVSNTSARGVYDALANMDARRVGILHTALDTTEPFQNTSATLTSISALPWKIQIPKLNSGATTAQCYWSCYARMATSGGTGGTVKLSTSVSGLSDSATITGTTFGWITSRAITVACDDFAAVDGYRNDELTIDIAGDGTRTVEVASVSIWVNSVA